MVDTRGTVGRRRSFVKGKGLRSLPIGNGFLENLFLFPKLKDGLPYLRIIYLFKFLVRFHWLLSVGFGQATWVGVPRLECRVGLFAVSHFPLGGNRGCRCYPSRKTSCSKQGTKIAEKGITRNVQPLGNPNSYPRAANWHLLRPFRR